MSLSYKSVYLDDKKHVKNGNEMYTESKVRGDFLPYLVTSEDNREEIS